MFESRRAHQPSLTLGLPLTSRELRPGRTAGSRQGGELLPEQQCPPLTLISVSVDEHAAAWREAVTREKRTWPQVHDQAGRMGRLFGIRPIPTVIVIDGEGIVRDRLFGYSGFYRAKLESGVRDALERLPGQPAR